METSSKKIKHVYVAGLITPRGVYSANLAIDHLTNQRKMVRIGFEVFQAGFDPFVPVFDHQFWMVMNDGEYITEGMIKRYSKSWLEVCDAVLLTPNWQKSEGTLAEIKHAEKLGIPVFKKIEDLIQYNENIGSKGDEGKD